MSRQQVKDLTPIIQAFAEGKTIEFRELGYKYWNKLTNPAFNLSIYEYRIKPEPKYRPFKDTNECWQEMQKHQPFGWIKDKEKENYTFITAIREDSKIGEISVSGNIYMNLLELMNNYTFTDGTPFGVKYE